MNISNCPKCDERVRIPPEGDEDSVVRCPHCSAEYSLGEVLAGLPPLLILAEVYAAATESDDEFRIAPDEPSHAVQNLPAAAIRATPRPRRAEKSAVVEVLKMVGGGLAGLVLAQLILWWVPGDFSNQRRDFLELAPKVARYAPFLVPESLRPEAKTLSNVDTKSANPDPTQDTTNDENDDYLFRGSRVGERVGERVGARGGSKGDLAAPHKSRSNSGETFIEPDDSTNGSTLDSDEKFPDQGTRIDGEGDSGNFSDEIRNFTRDLKPFSDSSPRKSDGYGKLIELLRNEELLNDADEFKTRTETLIGEIGSDNKQWTEIEHRASEALNSDLPPGSPVVFLGTIVENEPDIVLTGRSELSVVVPLTKSESKPLQVGNKVLLLGELLATSHDNSVTRLMVRQRSISAFPDTTAPAPADK